jgi:flagellar motor protein MotB
LRGSGRAVVPGKNVSPGGDMLTLPSRTALMYAGPMLVRLAAASRADAVIDGYPEYATAAYSLDPVQRHALRTVAETIVRTRSTLMPIEAVVVLGHADTALKKPASQRAAFELEVSEHRALSARDLILAEVRRLAYDAHYSKVLPCVPAGMGSTRRVVPNAATEAQMRRNRRVEIFLFERQLAQPRCKV